MDTKHIGYRLRANDYGLGNMDERPKCAAYEKKLKLRGAGLRTKRQWNEDCGPKAKHQGLMIKE